MVEQPGGEDSARQLRALKAWLLEGPSTNTKTEHQAARVQQRSDSELERLLSELTEPPDVPHGNTPKRRRRSET